MMKMLIVSTFLFLAAQSVQMKTYKEIKAKANFEMLSYKETVYSGLSPQETRNYFDPVSYKNRTRKDLKEKGFYTKQNFFKGVGAPANYDSRTAHSGCIGPIRNQLHCGSCWAFAAAETLSDNYCVNNGQHLALSAQDLVSCDTTDHGCHGGTLPNVWSWLNENGVTTTDCLPYTAGNGTVKACPLVCQSGEGITRFKCDHKNFLSATADIQSGIYSGASAETGFDVFEDFLTYKGGIYKHTTGAFLGGHAVKMIGWGQDPNTKEKYWLVANSWGPAWGESGFFRISWDDHESGMAEGGAFNCGVLHKLPTKTPTLPPSPCKDIATSCKDITDKAKQCPYMHNICLETCDCCRDWMKPDYCPNTTASPLVT